MNDEFDNPDWAPLTTLLPHADLSVWMWMCRTHHGDTVIERYKHRETRRYLNISGDGRTWTFEPVGDGCGLYCDTDHQHLPESVAVPVPLPSQAAIGWALS